MKHGKVVGFIKQIVYDNKSLNRRNILIRKHNNCSHPYTHTHTFTHIHTHTHTQIDADSALESDQTRMKS